MRGEVSKESGGRSTESSNSELMSIVSTGENEQGTDAAAATKHATAIEPPSGMFELSWPPLLLWQSGISDRSVFAESSESTCMDIDPGLMVPHSAAHELAIAGAIASQASRRDSKIRLITSTR